MEEIAGRIELYHRLSLLCLIGMVLFLGLSLLLFVRLDIRNTLLFFTGIRAKREIRRQEECTELLTARLPDREENFAVEREILLIHTDEIIQRNSK